MCIYEHIYSNLATRISVWEADVTLDHLYHSYIILDVRHRIFPPSELL